MDSEELLGAKICKGVSYPISRMGGPNTQVADTLLAADGREFFSAHTISTFPDAPKRGRSSSSTRQGDPCSNRFFYSLYEGAFLLLLAEGSPSGTDAAASAACSAIVGFSRYFCRYVSNQFPR